MNKSLIILVLTILLSTTIYAQQSGALQLNTLQTNNVTTANTFNYLTLPSMSSTKGNPLYGRVIPCFGEFNVYVGINYNPTANQTDFKAGSWNANSREIGFTFAAVPIDNTVVIGIQGLKSFDGKPSAIFQTYLIPSTNTTESDGLWPVPGNNGLVQLSLSNKGKSGQVIFTPSDNSSDTYDIYTFSGALPAGAFPNSACGVQQYATKLPNTIIENQPDGHKLITFSDLNPNVPTGVTIVVNRQISLPAGGSVTYSRAYSYGILNSSGIIVKASMSLITLMILCVFFVL